MWFEPWFGPSHSGLQKWKAEPGKCALLDPTQPSRLGLCFLITTMCRHVNPTYDQALIDPGSGGHIPYRDLIGADK